jgi:hypothetical protein
MTRHRLTFITPLFSKGSYEDRPEVRAPSIRGQLHWWFRALGGSALDENAIFGSVHAKPVLASKIVVRVADVKGQTAEANTLPHKRGGEASPKWAYKPGTTFDLLLTERLGGLTEAQRKAFRRTLEAWLLAGTLGLRATRAAGSFTWQPLSSDAIAMPRTPAEYAARLAEVFKGAPLRVHLLEPAYNSAEAARVVVSDTIGGPDGASDWQKLDQQHWPLGNVKAGPQKQAFPHAPQRKTSPLRFRIVQFGQAYHILAVWDNRTAVTGNQPGDFEGVIRLLSERTKRIGPALAKPLRHSNP